MDTKISYSAICAAFDGDEDIVNYCDPSIINPTLEGVIKDVFKKLVEYETLVDGVFKTIYLGENEVGFVYYFDDILISLGINKACRNKEFLTGFFEDIKSWLGNDFVTYMWERNERAVRWFEKCGMEREEAGMDKIIKLRYKLCL